MTTPTPFCTISAPVVRSILERDLTHCEALIASAYQVHRRQECSLPGSFFLRPGESPRDRIIGLPCSAAGDIQLSGIKWIASYPQNIARGLPRASAIMILNDATTGFPIACIEASIISAVRTAASASLSARLLRPSRSIDRIAVIGGGLISSWVHQFLLATNWSIRELVIHDLDPERSARFAASARKRDPACSVLMASSPDRALQGCDLAVFATTATTPHITEASWLLPDVVVLHLSLRDLAPSIIANACNLTDSIDHVMTAGTSLHRTEELTGHRRFVDAEIADLISGSWQRPRSRPVIVSPFGLGILDLVLAKHVLDAAVAGKQQRDIADFFTDAHSTGDQS